MKLSCPSGNKPKIRVSPSFRRERRHEKVESPFTIAGPKAIERPTRVLKVLRTFAWFCSKQSRKHIELSFESLKKDAYQMRQEGRADFFITCVLLWHVLVGDILPIIWQSFRRFLAAILPFRRLVSKIMIAWFLMGA
jgi:hypothetical protein